MQGLAGPRQDIEYSKIDEKTVQCLTCYNKFHKVLQNAHTAFHLNTSDKSIDLKAQKASKNPSIILNTLQPSPGPDSQASHGPDSQASHGPDSQPSHALDSQPSHVLDSRPSPGLKPQHSIVLPQKRPNSSSVRKMMSDFRIFSTATNQLLQIRERSNFILILHYFRILKKLS